MYRRFILIVLSTIVTLSALAAPAMVSAATTGGSGSAYDITATLSDRGTLLARVIVYVDLTATCSPQGDFGEPDPNQSWSYFSITEAIGKKAVARGSTFLSGVVCDGAAHTYQLAFGLDQSSPVPFEKGTAVVQGSVSVCGFNPNTFETGCGQANVGPTVVKIR